MIKKYQTELWLKIQYLNNKLSIIQIAKLCNCSFSTIRYWLIMLNIHIRPINEAVHLRRVNHCNLSEETKRWIDGELLGDGCLYSRSKYSAKFIYGSKYLEYINYVSNTLRNFGIKQAGKINKRYCENFKSYVYYYQSLSYEELLSIRERWYPNKKKIIPRDLKLTPLVCRQWYIGDGYLKHSKDSRPSIILYTNGFPVSDVEWLVKKLIELGFKATRRPSNNTIGISAHSTKEFLDYIGECPVKCYQYKWSYDMGYN